MMMIFAITKINFATYKSNEGFKHVTHTAPTVTYCFFEKLALI